MMDDWMAPALLQLVGWTLDISIVFRAPVIDFDSVHLSSTLNTIRTASGSSVSPSPLALFSPDMVDSVGVDTATIAAFFVEAVLYGAHSGVGALFRACHLTNTVSSTGFLIVLFMASMTIIFRRSRMLKDPLNKPMISASLLMLILATVVSPPVSRDGHD